MIEEIMAGVIEKIILLDTAAKVLIRSFSLSDRVVAKSG